MSYDCDVARIRAQPLALLRAELLALRGVGAETADVILVYAFHLPTFVVDAYTRTLLRRLGLSLANDAQIRRFFEETLHRNAEVYGNMHWLILTHCIARCKKKPVCNGCIYQAVCCTAATTP